MELKKDELKEEAERVVAMQLATAETQKAIDGDDFPRTRQKVLTEVAEKSLTVLKGECSFEGTDSISIVGGGEKEKTALMKAAKDAGLKVGSGGTSVSLSPSTSAEVAVGTAAPWTMRNTSAKSAVTAYDSNPNALQAVAKWLKGDLSASGLTARRLREQRRGAGLQLTGSRGHARSSPLSGLRDRRVRREVVCVKLDQRTRMKVTLPIQL